MLSSPLLRWPLALGVLALGVVGISAIWVSASILTGRPCSYMAFLAAFDAWLLLRLTGARAGPIRGVLAALGTTATIGLSYWLVVATHLGFALGLEPIPSAVRLGPVLAEALTRRFLAPGDLWLLGSAVAIAAMTGGRRTHGDRSPPVSARRQRT